MQLIVLVPVLVALSAAIAIVMAVGRLGEQARHPHAHPMQFSGLRPALIELERLNGRIRRR